MDPQTENKIEKEIIEVVADRLGIGVESVKRDSHIYDDLNASKLEFADLIQTLEEKYDFKFNIEEVKSLNTVASLIEYIENNVD